MTRGFSIYLDIIRFLAALVVLASHIGYYRFTQGNMQWIRDLNLGSDAVVLFFVLSGFVIAYTTFARNRGAAVYAEARLARLYSVIIPALVFTFVIDTLGAQLMPHAYEGWWYNAEDPAGQVLRALTFTTHAYGLTIFASAQTDLSGRLLMKPGTMPASASPCSAVVVRVFCSSA